jgi:16S rRNA (cytidine1402-2'-O)-methyltransferase
MYESSRRLKKFLEHINKNIPSRRIAIIRELTKKNEEVIRGTSKDVCEKINQRTNIKGEITIVLEGINAIKKNQFTDEEIIVLIDLYKKTMEDKEIVMKISSKLNISKRVVYQHIIDNK